MTSVAAPGTCTHGRNDHRLVARSVSPTSALRLAVLAVGAGCGARSSIDPAVRPPRDESTDASARHDAGVDGGHDAGVDGGHDAGVDGGCRGTPVALAAPSVGVVWALALGAADVYWLDDVNNGTVKKTPKSGGTVVTLSTGQSGSYAIAVDETRVYWTTYGAIVDAPVGGGAPTTLASGLAYAQSLALDAANVYWTGGAYTSALQRAAKAGGTPSTFAVGFEPDNIAVAGGTAYWTDIASGNVTAAPTAGGLLTTLAVAPGGESALAVDATSVYWFSQPTAASPALVKVPLQGGTPLTLVAGLGKPFGLAVDGTHVYWVDLANGTVMKVPTGGGQVATLACGQGNPAFIAVDATSVFWTANNGVGSVMKLTPK